MQGDFYMIASIEEGPFLVSHADGVLTLTFNRPEARNAIPTEAILPLTALFSQIASDDDVRVVLVKAKGENFGGGGDVAGMMASLAMAPAERADSYFQRLDNARAMVSNWCSIPQPIVTAVRGAVAGAAMMYPLGADVALGDPTSFFLCAHTHIGLSPDSGLSWMLPRAIGVKRATELFLTGRKVGAEEALSMGLISRIVPAETLEVDADKVALTLARGPANVLRDAKRMIAGAAEAGLVAQLELERDKVAKHVAAPDFEEGVRAFMEKRRPRFPSTQ
jgi:2-(1,2-epoxy-1,2-dihydrophenyl)acetyl-CoA isomerase